MHYIALAASTTVILATGAWYAYELCGWHALVHLKSRVQCLASTSREVGIRDFASLAGSQMSHR